MSTTVGSVAGSAVSTLLSPITFFLSSVSTLSSVADQGLRRLSAAVPDAVDQAAVDIGLAVDANARRKVELWNASREGNVEAVIKLLEQGADVNYVESTRDPDNNHNYWTSLQIACTHGHASVVRVLCDFGADRDFLSTFIQANNGSRYYWTALHVAASFGHVECVRELCQKPTYRRPPLPNTSTAPGTRVFTIDLISKEKAYGDSARLINTGSALIRACLAGHSEVARVLLEAGADVTKMDQYRRTPLHISCLNGRHDCVKLIIEHVRSSDNIDVQAFLFQEDSEGNHALQVAANAGHLDDKMLVLFPWYRRYWQACCVTPK